MDAARRSTSTFEDDGISWRVLKVEWSDEYESILVYYYDVEAVASRGKVEADLDDEARGRLIPMGTHRQEAKLTNTIIKETCSSA